MCSCSVCLLHAELVVLWNLKVSVNYLLAALWGRRSGSQQNEGEENQRIHRSLITTRSLMEYHENYIGIKHAIGHPFSIHINLLKMISSSHVDVTNKQIVRENLAGKHTFTQWDSYIMQQSADREPDTPKMVKVKGEPHDRELLTLNIYRFHFIPMLAVVPHQM